MKTHKKYLAFDGIDHDHEEFNTIEEARKHIEEIILGDDGYDPDVVLCKIYELKEIVDYDVTDSRENYDDQENWPYADEFVEVWAHKFVDVSKIES